MSGKFENKKSGRKQKHGMGIVLMLLLVALIACVFALLKPDLLPLPVGTESIAKPKNGGETTGEVHIETKEDVFIDLGDGLTITDIGSYTGMYMEDGSDEIVSGVLMMVVTNESEDPLQYAEVNLVAGDQNAYFSLSTLPAGASMVILEQNRMAYDEHLDYSEAEAQYVAWFSEPLSLREDKLKIQSMDGAMNVTNISGEDIDGEISIFFKNSSGDMLYGGITYRVRITDGLAAGEIKQIVSDHYSTNGSTIMFVTCR